MRGAFSRQKSAAHRIKAFLNFRHGQSLSDQIGFAKSVEERDDGLHGELRVLEGSDGDKALQLVREGMLDGLSIEFRVPPGGTKVVDGVVQRVRAHLDGVALVPRGAYAGAEVLAVRELEETEEIEEDDPSAELLEGLRYSDGAVRGVGASRRHRAGRPAAADARVHRCALGRLRLTLAGRGFLLPLLRDRRQRARRREEQGAVPPADPGAGRHLQPERDPGGAGATRPDGDDHAQGAGAGSPGAAAGAGERGRRMSEKSIWVPVKAPIVVVKQNENGVTEVDQSMAFELKTLAPARRTAIPSARSVYDAA